MTRLFNPPHPGLILQEWLGDMPVAEAARRLSIDRTTLSRLLHGGSDISPEMALRLEIALGTSPEMWMGLQADYDLWQASQRPRPTVRRILEAA
jgi:addiction module HigA family antidote